MIVKIDKSFEKDTDKLKDKSLLVKISDMIESAESAATVSEISNLKK